MPKEKNTIRDAQICKWYAAGKGFSPSEIISLLEREGFKPVSRIRILQIVGAAKGSKKK
ncbi:MAG TPA: hypothetical protein VIG74_04385 [Alphaproteobacteria bacterium]|jgi:hypothetical protein